MSWFSSFLNNITGKTVAQQQQQAMALQQQIYDQQRAEAEAQRRKMQEDEDKRQANIRGGVSAIDQAFAQFDNPFFQGAQDKYSGYYLPQIDEQAGNTRNKLIAKLFDRGMLESSEGANALSDLENKRLSGRARIGNEAADFSGGIRADVNKQRNALYDVARTAADPSAVAARATGEATTLASAPGGSMQKGGNLGDIFAGVLEPFSYAMTAKNNQVGSRYNPIGGGKSSVKLFG